VNGSEQINDDVQARLKAFAEANGYHTNVPIFNDSYSTKAAYQLVNQISSRPLAEKEKRKKARLDKIDAKKILKSLGLVVEDAYQQLAAGKILSLIL
jgi:hypothetical protein